MTGSNWRYELRPSALAPRDGISLDVARRMTALVVSAQQPGAEPRDELDEIDLIFAGWTEARHSADEIAVAAHLPVEVVRQAIAARSLSDALLDQRR